MIRAVFLGKIRKLSWVQKIVPFWAKNCRNAMEKVSESLWGDGKAYEARGRGGKLTRNRE